MNLEVLGSFVIALLFVGSFISLGAAIFRSFSISDSRILFRLIPIQAALGFSVCSHFGYLLIALRSPHPLLIIGILLVILLSTYRIWTAFFQEGGQFLLRISQRLKQPLPAFFMVSTLACLGLSTLNWATPSQEGDVLYGMMFTARWLYQEGFRYCPYNPIHFLQPFNVEIVFALTHAFNTDIIAKIIDGILGLLYLFGIYEFSRRYSKHLFAFIAAAGMGLMPAYYSLFGFGKTDCIGSFIFFSGISLIFLKRGYALKKTDVVIAAFLIGTACAIKHNYWVMVPAYLICLVYKIYPQGKKAIIHEMLITLIIIACCLIPYLVRNFIWTDNPIAPFGYKFFNMKVLTWGTLELADSVFIKPSWKGYILYFYYMFFNYSSLEEYGKISPFLLIGILFYLFSNNRKRDLNILLIVAAFMVGAWLFFTTKYHINAVRLIFPAIALSLVVASCGLQKGWKYKPCRYAIIILFCFITVYLGLWKHRNWRHSLPFVLGLEDRSAWQRKMVNWRGYDGYRRLTPHLGPGCRLFIMRPARGVLYNLPESALPYVNLEEENVLLHIVSLDEKLNWLRTRKYGYLSVQYENVDSWARDLPVVYQSGDGPNDYKIYLLNPACLAGLGSSP